MTTKEFRMSVDATLTQGQNLDSLEKTRDLSRSMLIAKGYELVSELGTGTYGVVWLAKDVRTGVLVAIKFFARGTGEQWQSLQEEVRQLAQLHAAPNIVRLLDVESESWPPYFVMDYAENGSLSARLKGGKVSVSESVELFRQIAQALAYVHAKGILHCDLKPGNILLDATNRALVADFGQAHLASDTSPALGTFFYMAPEQADLSQAFPDTRWDVYALGAILYAMLTGRPPREDSTLKQQLEDTVELSHRLKVYREKVQSAQRPRAHRHVVGVDRTLADIVDRCLEINPEKRFRDAQAVLLALRRRERHRRQRSLIAFGMIVPVVLLLMMGLVAWGFTNRMLDETQAALLTESIEGDLASAQLVAGNVQRHFEKYIRIVEETASDPRFVALVEERKQAKWNSPDSLVHFLESVHQRHLPKESRPQSNQRVANRTTPSSADLPTTTPEIRPDIFRWSFTDEAGVLRANAPRRDQDYGKSFSWRDWFNGTGDKTDKETTYPSFGHLHVSQPYVGTSGKPAVSISIPVHSPADSHELLGVFAISLDLQRLYEWIENLSIPNGQVVLFNERLHCLHHGDSKTLDKEKWWPKKNESPLVWESEFVRQSLQSDGQTDAAGYVDSLDGKTYLAGHSRVQTLGWTAIVQHERDAVMKRGGELRAEAWQLGLYGILVAGLMVPGMWGFLLWIIRREEQTDA